MEKALKVALLIVAVLAIVFLVLSFRAGKDRDEAEDYARHLIQEKGKLSVELSVLKQNRRLLIARDKQWADTLKQEREKVNLARQKVQAVKFSPQFVSTSNYGAVVDSLSKRYKAVYDTLPSTHLNYCIPGQVLYAAHRDLVYKDALYEYSVVQETLVNDQTIALEKKDSIIQNFAKADSVELVGNKVDSLMIDLWHDRYEQAEKKSKKLSLLGKIGVGVGLLVGLLIAH